MKRISKILVLAFITILLASMIGCFESDGTYSDSYSDYNEDNIEVVVDSTDNKKSITHSYDLNVEEAKVKSVSEGLIEKAKSYGEGKYKVLYEYHSASNDDSIYYYAKLVIKIPTENVADFKTYLGENAQIDSNTTKTVDFTQTIKDLQTRKTELETTIAQYESYKKSTDPKPTISDLILIEERLATYKEELEEVKSKLSVYESSISFSKIDIDIYSYSSDIDVGGIVVDIILGIIILSVFIYEIYRIIKKKKMKNNPNNNNPKGFNNQNNYPTPPSNNNQNNNQNNNYFE